MIRIERVAKHVAAFVQPFRLTQLLGACLGIMTTRAQRGEISERRIRGAARVNGRPMVDRRRGFDSTNPQARFAKRVLSQLEPT